jgi:glucose-6-phosphate-specific signal transduction histidine kinase
MKQSATPWIRFVTVATTYCAALLLFRHLSIPHWIILTGFHLAVLLLVDYKYWPALFVGETARLGYVSFSCYDQYGLLWALVNLVPSLTWEAPLVWFFRERLELFPSRGSVNMPALLMCSLMIAGIATAITLGQIQITPLPSGYVLHYGEISTRLMLGNFVGVLVIAPIALAAHQSFVTARRDWRQWCNDVLDSRLLFECTFVVVPLLVFFGWIGLRVRHALEVAQVAMFLPVAMMAMRYGWKGAAAGGTLASLGVLVLMPAQNNHAALQAETLVITTMLLVGARIAVLDRRAQQEHKDMRMALALAQRNVAIGEAQLRAGALALEQVHDSFQGIFTLMLGRLRHLQPAIDDAGYRRQAQNTQDQLLRLTNSLHPALLHERGLQEALEHGELARMLPEAGISYLCDCRGPLSLVSQNMNLSVYRIVAEAVAEACFKKDVSDVLIKIRCGVRARMWVVIMVETKRHPVRVQQVDWVTLSTRLRVLGSGLGRKSVEDRAATFEGQVRERVLTQSRRLIVSLLQPIRSTGNCREGLDLQ